MEEEEIKEKMIEVVVKILSRSTDSEDDRETLSYCLWTLASYLDHDSKDSPGHSYLFFLIQTHQPFAAKRLLSVLNPSLDYGTMIRPCI